MAARSDLVRGMNLRGLLGSVNMEPGEATACQDVRWREDLAFAKGFGWRRNNLTALPDPILAHKGFSYKGKNSPVGSTARPGNFGLANDGANYTRRVGFYSTGIALTDAGLYYWDPVAEAFAGPIVPPGGAAVVPGGNPAPTILVLQNNAYIVGWADHNLRYDPVDRALYWWGWANPPANAGHVGPVGGGTLVAGATYRYRASYVDIYTGEESALSVEFESNPAGANLTTRLNNFAVYPGVRHYNDGAGAAGDDVGIAIYRTDPDGHAFYFLTLLNPNVTTFDDTGLAVDYSLKGDTRAFIDAPNLNAAVEYRGMWFGLSWDTNWARVYYNDFRAEKSFIERCDPRDYRELPIEEGEYLTCPAKTDAGLVMFTQKNAHSMLVVPNVETGKLSISIDPLLWPTGCVGPQAWAFREGGLYWLSERGPYRFKGGVVRYIGANVQPLFIDPHSGLCQLNVTGRVRAKCAYNQDQEKMHFSFPCGPVSYNNRHISYWMKGEENGLRYYQGWTFESPIAEAFDSTHVYEPLMPGGVPVAPQDKAERFVFADEAGFLYEYEPASERGGPRAALVVTGVGQAGSTVNVLVTTGGLEVGGNGLEGYRLEVVFADGAVDVRRVGANTAVNITPDLPFSQDPTGATWYVGGIPCYWRSWFDHAGEPAESKTLLHQVIGMGRVLTVAGPVLNLAYFAGDFATVPRRRTTAALNQWREKVMVSTTGRFHQWEVSNTRPDEPFCITYFDNEYSIHGKREP